MGLLSLDYFRCEPFELNFRLYVFGGFWPLETDVKWKKNLFSFFSFLCYFSLTSMVVNQLLDIYLLRNDPVGVTRDLCTVSMSFTIVIKSLLILFKVNLINYLKDKFSKYKNTRTDPSDVEILEKSNKRILVVLKSFYSLTLPCVFFWLIFPVLDSAEKRVPFPYTLPFEEWPYPVYVSLYVYQAFSMIGFMINTLSVDTMFCGFVLRINAHYDIIIKNLKGLGKLEDCQAEEYDQEDRERKTKIAKRILRRNIELHKNVLRDIELFQEIYGPTCVMHFLGIIIIVGTAIIDFVRVAKGFRLQLMQKLLYLSITLLDCFLYCVFAGEMSQKSLEMSQAVYATEWYNMEPRIRKDLRFLLFKCQKVPRVKVAHFFYLNLKTFVNILKVSYDITALLYQTIKE